MVNYPKLKAKYHVEDLGTQGIVLLAENERHVLEGEHMLKVVPFMNGQHSTQDIIRHLSEEQAAEHTQQAITTLLHHGHITEHSPGIPPSQEIFWSELGLTPQQAQALTQSVNIHIRHFDRSDPRPFRSALQSFGFQTNAEQPATMVLAIAEDYQLPQLEDLNTQCLRSGVPWMLVKPTGLLPLLGPIFIPHKTACWKCLETRLRHNREVEAYIESQTQRPGPYPVTKTRIPLAEQQIVSTAVLQLIKWLATGHHEDLEGRIVAYSMFHLGNLAHPITKRPQCEACGTPALAQVAGKPIYFQHKVGHAADGNGFRPQPPEATYARYQHHISTLTGIVNGVNPSTWQGRSPLHVYTAGHNFAVIKDGLHYLKAGLRTHSAGKGRSEAQARTSALCEALERFSGMYRPEEAHITASYEELGEHALHPNTLMLYSNTQYQERDAWLQRGEQFSVVPHPFEEDAQIQWTPVWSHTRKRTLYLPTSLLFYSFSDGPGKFFCWGDSNGNAAGSSIEDAALQGFFEVVERDAVAIWWYNRLQRPAVDLASLQDPYIGQLQDFFTQQGREFWVLDITADTGIPTFVAITRRTDHAREDIIMGFGAHLDARIGINRALTEMNQMVVSLLDKDETGNAIIPHTDPALLNWWNTATLENQPYLQPAPGPARQAHELPACEVPDMKDQLDRCFGLVQAMGHEVLIMNQTLPDVGLPVVKVMIPGFRHFWARYAPGRLYQVPVKLGWLKAPLAEEALNPIPMFL